MKKQNVRTLGLIVVTFAYLLLGAAVFDALESRDEQTEGSKLLKTLEEFKVNYSISQDDMNEITTIVLKTKNFKNGSSQWRFAGSFYFSTTVITTIGYGHSTPKTQGGKMFCMAYALPGIPLCIVMFQSIGERLNAFLTFFLHSCKRCLKVHGGDITSTHLICFSMSLCLVVLCSGAAAFSHFETWNYMDALYYCFITLTTIGFGDFVALQRNNSLESKPEYVAFSLIFILFGLAVVSSAMNLLVLRFLTMNTDDQRKEDELRAQAAAQNSYRLRGDIILNVNQSFESHDEAYQISTITDYTNNNTGHYYPSCHDAVSVCSCSNTRLCYPCDCSVVRNQYSNERVGHEGKPNTLPNNAAIKKNKKWRRGFFMWTKWSSGMEVAVSPHTVYRTRYTRTRAPCQILHLALPKQTNSTKEDYASLPIDSCDTQEVMLEDNEEENKWPACLDRKRSSI